MKRKLLALAMSQLFVPCVFAQGSNVTIYGRFHVTFENVEADGSSSGGGNLGSRNRVSNNSSYIGFRGTEDLGNGLKAIFQVEQGIAVDTGSASSSGGTFASRNSNAGLAGAWGTVFYGNWDTPYKVSTASLDPFYQTSIASAFRHIIGTPGGNVPPLPTAAANAGGVNAAGFTRRENNSVQYWTPSYRGLSGRIAYEANEGKTATANPYLWSVAAIYDSGPLFLSAAYERHEDFLSNAVSAVPVFPLPLGTPTGSRDFGARLGAGYRFGNTRIVGVYERLDYSTSGAAVGANVDSFEKDNYFLGASHTIGKHILRAGVSFADDGDCSFTNGSACSTNDLGASAYSLGYGHAFSKRTEVYVFFTRIDNESRAAYNFGQNGLGATVTGSAVAGFAGGIAAGSNLRGFGLGIRHNF